MRPPIAALLGILLAGGCHAAPGLPARGPAASDRVFRALAETTGVSPLCGAPATTHARLRVFVTARDCLSCRDIGMALRRLVERFGDGGVELVVPVQDSTPVCRFVADERVRLPVSGVRDLPAGRLTGSRAIAYLVLDTAGVVVDSAIATDGLQLLQLLREPGPGNGAPRRRGPTRGPSDSRGM